MMNQRQIAKKTGVLLLIMAIIAGFSIGYAYPIFDNHEQFELTKNNILENQGMYLSMLIGILIIIILDFIVAYTLYKYFEDNHKNISLISGIIRGVYTLVFCVATFYLIKNLNTDELTNEIAISNFRQFQLIWNSGLVVFGFHILLIGYLMKLHLKIPGVLWVLTLIAGISYIIISILKVENPNSEIVKALIIIFMFPMTVGELGLAIWLLLKGGKETRKKNSPL